MDMAVIDPRSLVLFVDAAKAIEKKGNNISSNHPLKVVFMFNWLILSNNHVVYVVEVDSSFYYDYDFLME